MLYIMQTTHTDGHKTQTTVNAHSPREAHEQTAHPNGATVRAFADTSTPYGVLVASIQCAYVVARRTQSGTPTQRAIYNDLCAARRDVFRNDGDAEYLARRISECGQDAQDFIGVASLAIWTAYANGGDVDAQYYAAYIAINDHVRGGRAATDKERTNEYTTDGDGNTTTYAERVAAIIDGDTVPTATASDTMTAADAQKIADAIHAAARDVLTDRQRDVLRYIGRGYSVRTTAERLHVKRPSTINDHLTIIRRKIAAYVATSDEYRDVSAYIDYDAVYTAAAAMDTRKPSGGKDTQAERAKRYRERKKAEREAANA